MSNVIKGVAETKGMNRAAAPIDFKSLSEEQKKGIEKFMESRKTDTNAEAPSLTEEALAIAEQMMKKDEDLPGEDPNEITEDMVKYAEK